MPTYPSDEGQLIVTGILSYIFRNGIDELCKFIGLKDREKRNIYENC